MADRLERLEGKMDDLVTLNGKQEVKLGIMTEILDKNTESLIEHSARTAASEERQSVVEDTLSVLLKKIDKSVGFVNGAMWFGGIVLAIFGLAIKFGIIKI
tara:strand:+ start:2018 stop:2320 length:303 start_codon:yes stop_codon:yes gene_type:complete